MDTFGNAPPTWLQSSFAILKPVSNLIEKYLGFYERMTDEKFLEEFFAMETWVNDNIPVAGETFRQFVKDCFQRNPVQGKLRLGARTVNLANITCPILNLMASGDHLVPCGQSGGIQRLRRVQGSQGDHVPGRSHRPVRREQAQKELWPKVCEWLAERSETVTAGASAGRGTRKSPRPIRR